MARSSQRGGAQRRNRNNAGPKHRNEEGIIPVLARVVREVEQAVQRQSTVLSVRTKFQVVALLVREERIRVKADPDLSDNRRAEELKRLDGVATILAQTAARDSTLFTLLDPDADSAVDVSVLFGQTFVDQARLADNIRSVVPERGSALLTDIVRACPVEQGAAEIVGYLALTDDDLEVTVDEQDETCIDYGDGKVVHRARLPKVTVSRR